jgi:methyl-accepting chemotaxis protein
LANQTDRATGDIQSQVNGIQGSSRQSVDDIGRMSGTIARMNEVTTIIAAAIEEQSSATQEISASVQRAASGTREVSVNVAGVSQASVQVTDEARRLLATASTLRAQSGDLKDAVRTFLASVRAA